MANEGYLERRRGPSVISVKEFSCKLDSTLAALGRNQSWLANCLGVVPGTISHWKLVEQVPLPRLQPLCRVLGVERQSFTLDDCSRFREKLHAQLAVGSGGRFRALVTGADSTGLHLVIEAGVNPMPSNTSLGSVRRHPAASSKPTNTTIVRLDNRIRLRVNKSCLNKIVPKPDQLALLVEDINGLSVIVPNNDSQRLYSEDNSYLLPGPTEQALYVDEPTGRHAMYLIVASDVLPSAVRTGFLENRYLPAADELACWLLDSNVIHVVRRLDFLVTVR